MWPKLFLGESVAILMLLSNLANAETIQVTVDQLQFTPSQVSAHVGDTIEWVDKGFLAHTATEKNDKWEVAFEPGESKSIVVSNPGTIDYYCRLHPNMTGQIIVKDK